MTGHQSNTNKVPLEDHWAQIGKRIGQRGEHPVYHTVMQLTTSQKNGS
jgi:hypothetical protein